ncbi:TPA: hypothetical protein ACGO8H_001879, partial [Streptococcus suis]
EYNLGQGTLTYWLQQYRKECDNSPTKREESDSYEVAKKLRKEIEELKKEVDVKKKFSKYKICKQNRSKLSAVFLYSDYLSVSDTMYYK